jgi:hypothetical protein
MPIAESLEPVAEPRAGDLRGQAGPWVSWIVNLSSQVRES